MLLLPALCAVCVLLFRLSDRAKGPTNGAQTLASTPQTLNNLPQTTTITSQAPSPSPYRVWPKDATDPKGNADVFTALKTLVIDPSTLWCSELGTGLVSVSWWYVDLTEDQAAQILQNPGVFLA